MNTLPTPDGHVNHEPAEGARPHCYEDILALAAELGRSPRSLLALAKSNDPYAAGLAWRRRWVIAVTVVLARAGRLACRGSAAERDDPC
jgi:hypothetical protein